MVNSFDVLLKRDWVGMALVIEGACTSITRHLNACYLFDSHGSRTIGAAFVKKFTQLDALKNALRAMIPDRMDDEVPEVGVTLCYRRQ